MNETITHYDVRFFGGKYERSLLIKSSVKSIKTPQSKLQIKSSVAFNKSVDELKFHQVLLKSPDDIQKLLGNNKSRGVNKNRKSSMKTGMRSSTPYDKEIYKNFDNVSFPQQNHSASFDRRKRRSSFYDGKKDKSIVVNFKRVFCVGSPPVRKRSSANEDKSSEIQNVSADSVIHISDGEDEDITFKENYSLTNLR